MKIATWNVNGIRARQAQFVDWVNRDRPDILCLQEIKAAPAKVPELLLNLDGYWNYWHGAGGYSGVSVHIRKDLCMDCPNFVVPEFDFETRILSTRVGQITVASVYVPNGGKDLAAKMQFLESLHRYASQETGPLILCGDMNVARTDMDVHPKERKPNAIGQLPEERAAFERILSAGFVDLCRKMDPSNDQLFTWWPPWRNMRQRNIGWRIDYMLASAALAERVTGCSVLAEIGTSDHAPICATFDIKL